MMEILIQNTTHAGAIVFQPFEQRLASASVYEEE